MELFAKIGNDWKPLTYLAKSSILDIWLVSQCASEILPKTYQIPETAICVDISKNVKVKKKLRDKIVYGESSNGSLAFDV